MQPVRPPPLISNFSRVAMESATMLADMAMTTTPTTSRVATTATPLTLRARKHDITFLLDAPPEKRERLLQHSSPVSTRALSPLIHPPPIAVPAPASPLYNSTRPQSVSCSECTFLVHAPETLSAHARASHPNKPFACRICGRCFGEKGNMNKHFRTVHLKQRKHQCKICHRQFAFLDGLNRHISMVHLDRRPFECTECQCPGGRHSAAQMCTHICGMKFKQKSHRRRHIRSVHQAPLPDNRFCLRCSMPVPHNSAHICSAAVAILGAHNAPVLH